jgi:hypothetical protein
MRQEDKLQIYRCLQCGYEWVPRVKVELPRRCPKDGCRSERWNREGMWRGVRRSIGVTEVVAHKKVEKKRVSEGETVVDYGQDWGA